MLAHWRTPARTTGGHNGLYKKQLENPPDNAAVARQRRLLGLEFLASNSRHAAPSGQPGKSRWLQRTHGMVA
jgi:hypothetical protein